MGTKMVNIRLQDDVAAELSSVVDEKGITITEFIRKLIDEALYPSKKEAVATLWDSAGEELKAKVEELDSEVSQMMEDLTDGTAARDEKFAELKTSVTQIGEKSEDIRRNLAALDVVYNQTIENFDKKTNEFEARIHELVDVQGKANELDKNLLKRIAQLESNLVTITGRFEAVKDKVNSLSGDVIALQISVKGLHDLHLLGTKSGLDDGKHNMGYTA
jgi:chromosome segregation ATPase